MPRAAVADENRIQKPSELREVPTYIKTLTSTFFFRLFYIFRLVWEARPALLFLMVGMSIFSGIIPVVGSFISASLLNELTRAYSGELLAFSVIAVLLAWQFGYMLFRSMISRIYSTMTSISGDLVANHIKRKLMTKARSIDLSSYDQPEFYARIENASREAGTRPVQVLGATFSIVSSIISMVSYSVILFSAYPWAPFVMIAASVPTTLISYRYRKKNVDYMIQHSKDRRQMEYYSGILMNKDIIKEVRMFHLDNIFMEKYQSVFDRYFKGTKRLRWHESWWTIAVATFTSIASFMMYIFLAHGVFSGLYTVGDFSLYTGALQSISGGVGGLISTTASIYEGTLFIDNLIAFLNEKPRIVPRINPAVSVKRNIGHTIEFENVSFRYPGTERDVLRDVSLTINAGETIALVGLNGAGKTTLLKLLTRLYDPSEGRVLLDGRDIRDYSVEEIYSIYGMIFQDFGKYAVTIRENIIFGDVERADDWDAIFRATEQSDAADFIKALPEKYETPLTRIFEDKGIELSIGQWQKLAIARAFYRNSDILILDEPTASLDPMAEQEIFQQFERLRENKTTIFVSHRLSSATLADRIIVMHDGKVIEQGNHVELMNLGREYATLFTAQASRYQ